MNQDNPLVCVIDDDSLVRESLSRLLRSVGLKVQAFASAQAFLASLPSEAPSCLVLDVQMPGISGLELQRQLGDGEPRVPIVFMTGYGDIPMSVRAMRAGAVEFLTKPCRDEDLLSAVKQAIGRAPLTERLENRSGEERLSIEDELHGETRFRAIVGNSVALRDLLRQVDIVAASDATVLILGETGTGKELIARAIHQCSRRRDRSLIRVNCTSIPKELFESEFFGHAKGAFTSAVKDRIGRFEAAAGGTLFLDEIGEIPLELQSKLLRVLQEKCYERVGEERTRHADVRIVAATNRDLKKEVKAGRFREDLYYRLNVFPMRLAPLRDRREDIPLLATHFIESSLRELGCPRPRLTRAGIESLQAYDWPGNIRELRSVIERAVIFARGGALEFDLPTVDSSPDPTPVTPRLGDRSDSEYLTDSEMQRLERENLFAVLEKTGWKIKGIDGAAELLGVKPTTLISRIGKMGLKRPS